jgi:hypothetical protein
MPVSKTTNNRLQPYHVFMAELDRLNRVYWTSRYALERVPATLQAIASTASAMQDPPVDSLWASPDSQLRKQLKVPLSKFRHHASIAIESIRAASIVGICSAFENALVNYFVLACLYNPKRVLTGWNHSSVPKILKSQEAYAKLRKRASERAAEVLRAEYGTRVVALIDAFGGDRSKIELPANLKVYYGHRHLLAHNQGVEDDGPWLPPDELVAARIVLDEATWRGMLGDFNALMWQLDSVMQTIVPDRAIHLAVHWVMEHLSDDWITLGKLRNSVNVGWHLLEPCSTIEAVAMSLGYKVSGEKQPIRRHVTKR